MGGTGAVGSACLDVLTNHPAAAGVQVLTDRVDVTDVSAVTAAAGGCDVVINCAGPSQRFSAPVAAAVIAAGVAYVDPGGDQALLERIAAPAVPVVLQAGVQPGLSGLLLRFLAQRRTGIDEITAWCGGLQALTRASVLEYLASLHDTRSHPGAALRAGVIRRLGPGERKPAPAQYFPDSATVHPHLDAETVAVSAQLGIGNVLWLNVFDGVHTTRAMQLLTLDDQQRDWEAVLAAAKLDLFGRLPYFAIVAEGRGTGGAQAGTTTVAFSCSDSYRSTGALAAFAALHVTDMAPGVHPLSGIDEPQRVMSFLAETVPDAKVSCFEDTGAEMISELIEEGSL